MSRQVAGVLGMFVWLVPAAAWAGDSAGSEVVYRGSSGFWTLANFSYAGMRAQNHPSAGWRIAAFICGFPGTLLSYFCVAEGGYRAYGVRLPRE